MPRLDIYVCTKSKCTAKSVQVKLRVSDAKATSYNGPALLAEIRQLVSDRQLQDKVYVHEVACMAGCPVGPRVDMVADGKRVMYFRRPTPTGRDDLLSWVSVESVESAMNAHLSRLSE
ncbi:MAG: hypothetical protein AB7G75_20600 [Candidatus Binatia bacterium]